MAQPPAYVVRTEHLELTRSLRGRFDLDQDRIYAVLDTNEKELLGEAALLTRAGEGAREMGYRVSSLLASEYPASPAARLPVKAHDIVGELLFEAGAHRPSGRELI
ncbi:hypothetical protein JQX13_01945 [Archangium violaceum]|uniref:hypothetical protein n=1 Tax=Archangium violaceum TaxID=83451 RepID=UPI00193C2CFB|nr:hypothetical protein [Archangium violaceum]QRK08958.1 hypothetical protein JQX13_01945 [Archangium violaceum]